MVCHVSRVSVVSVRVKMCRVVGDRCACFSFVCVSVCVVVRVRVHLVSVHVQNKCLTLLLVRERVLVFDNVCACVYRNVCACVCVWRRVSVCALCGGAWCGVV